MNKVEYLAASETCKAYSPDKKDRPFGSSGFSAKGIVIFASEEPHSAKRGGRIRGKK